MQQSLRHTMKQLVVLLGRHLISFVTIAAVLQIGMTVIGGYLLKWLFRLSLLLANQSNLDMTNAISLMRHPYSLLAMLIFGICFAALFFVELSILIYIIYARQQKKQISYRAVVLQAIGRLRHLFGLNFLYFVAYMMVTLPISGIVMQSSLTSRLYVPEFITGEFLKTGVGTVLMGAVAVVLIYLNLRLVYTMPLMMIKNQSFLASLRESWAMSRHKLWKLIVCFILFALIWGAIVLGLIVSVIEWVAWVDPSGNQFVIQALFLSAFKFISFLAVIVSKVGALIILVDQVVAPEWANSHLLIEPSHHRHRHWAVLLVFGLIFAKIGENAFLLAGQSFQANQTMIAHRGYTAAAVENTLEALEAAAKEGAGAVELDVQMTKDHRLVVMHDLNLSRLAGVNQRVADMTYDQVVGLPLKQGGHEATLPSFEAFVRRAQELNMPLLIELKPHGQEPDDYAQRVIDELRRLGIAETYPVMSLNREAMDSIETLAPEIQTGVVIPIQFGAFSDSALDFYVLEDFSYRAELLEQAHRAGKQVYVWTINDPDKLQEYFYQPVDGIISDELALISEMRATLSSQDTYFDRVWHLVLR